MKKHTRDRPDVPDRPAEIRPRLHDQLSSLLKRGVHPHAILLIGPKGTGKLQTALTYARALNCDRTLDPIARSEPCAHDEDRCVACLQIDANTFPDVRVVEPDEGRLKIAQIREVIEQVRLSRLSARRKLIVLNDADRIVMQAANAVLKTLEEPPPETTIILIARSTRGLPVTVLSRCWQIRFPPLPFEAIGRLPDLEGLAPDHLKRVVQYSHGMPDKALRYAGLFRSGDAMKFLTEYWSAVKEGGEKAGEFAERYGKSKGENTEWIDVLADAHCAALVRTLSGEEEGPYPPRVWLGLVDAALRAKRDLDVNANRRLLFERLVGDARALIRSASG